MGRPRDDGTAGSKPDDRARWTIAVFATALALRLIHLWQIGGAPFADMLLGDAESYHVWALEIVAGGWVGRETFYQAPLYPYFLATIYAVTGEKLHVVRLLQALIDSGSCALLLLAGWRFFGRRSGIIAGFLLAFYGPAIFSVGILQKSVLDLFFLSLVLYVLSRRVDAPTGRPGWYLLGLFLAALVLTRENAVVLVAGVCIWVLVTRTVPRPSKIGATALVLTGLATLLLPVALRNWHVGGGFHLTTSQLGPNLFIGNNERASGIYEPLRPRRGHPRFERIDATEIAEAALGRSLTPGEVSRYYVNEVLRYARDQPGDWAALQWRKLRLAWNAVEVVDTEDPYTHAEWSIPLRGGLAWVHFGVLAPLALVGLVVTWDRRQRLWLLYLLLGLYTASVVAFYVFGRYRYPMVPFLVLFAAAGLNGIVEWSREANTRSKVALGLATLLVAVFCNWPMMDKARMRGTTRFNMGAAFEMRGERERALEAYREALRIRPDQAAAHQRLGTLLAEQGDAVDAREHLRNALRYGGENAATHFLLGRLAAAQGDAEAAVAEYELALRLDPALATAHYNLGNLYLRGGQPDRAAAHYRQAIEINPDYSEAHNNLGGLYLQHARPGEAIRHYEEALRTDPGNVQARFNLARALELRGLSDRAAKEYERVLALDPSYERARQRLAALRGSAHRQGDP